MSGYYVGCIRTLIRRYIATIVASGSRLRQRLSFFPRRLFRALASGRHSFDGPMATFDIVVVGCGGGPNESNLSFYLLKAGDAKWQDGIVALEGGSGFGALTRLLDAHPDLFASESSNESASDVSLTTAVDVYNRIRCYLVTHAHLDHVNGMVLSAGCGTGPAKLVYGTKETLQGISTIFSGEVWPKLASWADAKEPGSCLLLSPLPLETVYAPVARDISVRLMPISHGQRSPGHTYPCSAYFVRHDPSSREFLFFGDVEPDSVSLEPQNREIWRVAAPKVPDMLSAIFIECSYPSGRPDELLYGHLSPEHLMQELCALAVEVVSFRQRSRLQENSNRARKKKRRNTESLPDLRGSLAGLRVYVIHCKEDLQRKFKEPIHTVIANQVRELVDAKGLGVEIIAAEQRMHIRI
ncbi:cyclic-AMP phosphodiesterase [Dichomitus squalens LYAD-421 SS1]|uniref:cyclic-AMP phosphodiesterase n=1 Tax=Dichomitus squalens (strain LYAD-421) TaxID=732165 RepID=UPI00044113B2|nr:cyclic-AMP phosphodiesterase [Dichomitus squalens LYAD-421 SS1]EJF62453.1 cyclic-AMP phosphodiesterase [Dichomitus squalens LYAD-421 SS1]